MVVVVVCMCSITFHFYVCVCVCVGFESCSCLVCLPSAESNESISVAHIVRPEVISCFIAPFRRCCYLLISGAVVESRLNRLVNSIYWQAVSGR